MSTYIFIPGKDPELSRAELEARYGAGSSTLLSDFILLEKTGEEITQADFNKLGGQIKMGKLIGKATKKSLVTDLIEYLADEHESGKLNYGISLYNWPEKNLRSLLLELKKEFKRRGVSSRFANQNFKNISVAQHKGLKGGTELLVCKDGDDFIGAEVTAVQDIDAYSKRDFHKPFRDMKVGMLPPKLAQILINLTGSDGRIWDPFCGGGVLIMEGLLMGQDMLGSDINETTLKGAQQNVDWVKREFGLSAEAKLMKHDARNALKGEKVDAIAFEGYLGPPQSRIKSKKDFEDIVRELTQLYVEFFRALGKFKGPVVTALPFFRTREGELHLDVTIEAIEKIGFKKDLNICYAREDQMVGRDIYRFRLSSVV